MREGFRRHLEETDCGVHGRREVNGKFDESDSRLYGRRDSREDERYRVGEKH